MRHTILLLLLYGAALFISCELRPFIIQPPDNLPDAKQEILGLWTGTEGWGSWEDKLEIEFRSPYAYTIRSKQRGEEWKETDGYYQIDTTHDRSTGALRCAVQLDNVRKDDFWFFRGGDVLYPAQGSARVSKNLSFTGILVWYVLIPAALMSAPGILLWHKVDHPSPEISAISA